MSYVIEQKIKGNIYLYRVESKWDKTKKKTYQKRTYLGPKNPKKSRKGNKTGIDLINKNYGNIFLLQSISKRIGLEDVLRGVFPGSCNEILALSYYEIMEGAPFYLFNYWMDENFLPQVHKLDSSAISNLFSEIGKDERSRHTFIENWIEYLQPTNAMFFDISSISCYSTNINFIEWGYNRDKERMPQLNIGMVYCENKRLPINYFVYPGSIVDVTTLKNCKKYLEDYGLKTFLFVLDRGFFSTANINEMNDKSSGIEFIQPLPFTLKKVKSLVKNHRRELTKVDSAFSYKNEILNYKKSSIAFNEEDLDAHMFYNEKAEVDVRHNFLSILFEIENKLSDKRFDQLKYWLEYKNNNILEKYRDFFKWNKQTKKAERNIKIINTYLYKAGYYIMATNKQNLSKCDVLNHYRNKDLVEKVFDVLKNEMDCKRLRTHNDYTTSGKLFVMFISLLIYSEIIRIMNQEKLFKTLTIKEVLYELRKIKINNFIKDGNPIISEVSTKQKTILNKFEIDLNLIHSY